jgi:hypothetical protein
MVAGSRAAAANRRRSAAAALTAAAGLLLAADSPTGGEPGVHAFVLSNIYIASSGDVGACPVMADGGLETFFRMLPPQEQAKYAKPGAPTEIEQAKRGELEQAMNRHFGFRRVAIRGGGPGGRMTTAVLPAGFDPEKVPTPEDALRIGALSGFPKGRGRLAFSNLTVAYSACTNPEDFPSLAEGFRTYDGKVAPGIDLDGKTGKEDFTGLDGGKGVDNQLWRAVGCVKPFREYGEPEIARKTFISARAPTLIELRGVDDLGNDPEVTVHVYGSADPVVRDGRGEALARASFAPDPDRRLRSTTRGRIVNGVLTTDPVDLRLSYKEQIVDAPRVIRAARIRATFKPDGGIEGSFFGYYDIASYWRSIEQMTQNGANLTGVSCPGVKQAIERLADGYRDKRTGRFTAISSAYNFFGVRAFVVGPEAQAAR